MVLIDCLVFKFSGNLAQSLNMLLLIKDVMATKTGCKKRGRRAPKVRGGKCGKKLKKGSRRGKKRACPRGKVKSGPRKGRCKKKR